MYLLRHQLAYKVGPLVWLAAGLCLFYLRRESDFARGCLWCARGLREHLGRILLSLAGGALPLALYTYYFLPDKFLALPRQRPILWGVLLVLYPLLAAYPQELLFRAFFFQRYQRLFPGAGTMILASALSFGLAHVFYGNPVAPLASLLGGLLFGYRYQNSGSLLAAGLEHGLWGNLLYTLGLGWYFYSGSIT